MIQVTHEEFCKAYFITHCRQGEGLSWDQLDRFGKQWWEAQARGMWQELSRLREENAA